MKTHPLLKAASGLHIACGIASLLTMVYFTVFQVLLAADEDPDVNIAIMACYTLLTACWRSSPARMPSIRTA